MSIDEYILTKKKIEDEIIHILDQSERNEYLNFTKLRYCLNDQKILENENEFRLFIHLIISVANEYHHFPNFYDSILNIFEMVRDFFQKYLTNKEIYDISKSNKRLLLYFLENQIIKIDPIIAHQMIKGTKTMINYFFNELQTFIINEKGKEFFNQIQKENSFYSSEDFEKNRKSGENDQYICQLIQNDSIKEFVIYVNQTNLSLKNTKIKPSIFDSSKLLLKNEPTLIEYAAFYGSMQIFKYLQLNGVDLTPSLWTYAIYGKNYEMIHLLEDNHIKPLKSYSTLCITAIKCHHNELAKYFLDNFIDQGELQKISIITYGLKYYNFNFLSGIELNSKTIFDICSYDYFFLLNQFSKENDFNINFKIKVRIEEKTLFLSPFQKAIYDSNHNIIKFLMKYPEANVNEQIEEVGKDPNEKSSYSLLEYSIWINDLENAEILLKNEKIDVNALSEFSTKNGHKQTKITTCNALCRAILKKNTNFVKLIMSHKNVDVNLKLTENEKDNYSQITERCLFQYAIDSKNIEIIKLFLNNPNIDVNIIIKSWNNKYSWIEYKYDYNESPLYYSISHSNKEIINFFVNHPKIDINYKSIFKSRSLLVKNETILNKAINKNKIEIIKVLLKHPQIDINMKSSYISKNEYDETALTLATREKKYKIVKLLLTHPKIDVNIKVDSNDPINNKQKLSALHLALINNDKEMVLILLSHKNIDINLIGSRYIEITKYKFSPLIFSIMHNQYDIFELLLSNEKIDVNTQLIKTNKQKSFEEIKSALFLAVEESKENMVQCLLTKPNIDVNFESTFTSSFQIDKLNVLYKACEIENINMVKLLLKHPLTDINSILFNKSFESKKITVEKHIPLLHYMIQLKNKEILQLLLENSKINTNITSVTIKDTELNRTKDVKNTIQIACNQKSIEIFKIIFDFIIKSNEDSFLNEYKNIDDYNEIKILVNDKIKSTPS